VISWVLAARNDGYGGSLAGVGNFAMRRLQITVESILAAFAQEILVVEWCPPPDRDRLRAFLPDAPGLRLLTVPAEFQAELDAANPAKQKLPFYEYLAKHVGILHARGDIILACNGDNIFPWAPAGDSPGLPKTLTSISDDRYVRAVRHEIAAAFATLPISELLHLAENHSLPVLQSFRTAGGDFCGFTRAAYDRLGGYTLVHGNRQVDYMFDRAARRRGIERIQTYEHYHLHHENSIGEAPGRPLKVAEAPPIEPDLVTRCVSSVEEIRL